MAEIREECGQLRKRNKEEEEEDKAKAPGQCKWTQPNGVMKL
jgi:hypothetical protein